MFLLQGWLDRHGPFDVIVDGANVGLFNQNFGEGGFNFYQVFGFSMESHYDRNIWYVVL